MEKPKRFFNLLALVKYVLESKACVPFPEEENTRPYKKPNGYELYHDENDRIDFNDLEPKIKKEIEEKVKRFHYFRNKFEDLTKSILVLSGIKGGQHTISIQLFRLLIARLESKNIKVEYKKVCNLYSFMSKGLKGHITNNPLLGFKKILQKLSLKNHKKQIAELNRIEFLFGQSSISISALVYHVDNEVAFVSLVENSIKDVNGEECFLKIESEIDRIIRLIPIMDII
jgi:hypothetical protein